MDSTYVEPKVGRTVTYRPHTVGARCEFSLHTKQGKEELAYVEGLVADMKAHWGDRNQDKIYFDPALGHYVWDITRMFVTAKED